MFATHGQDSDHKKSGHGDALEGKSPEAIPSAVGAGAASHNFSAATAAPVLSHWAEGGGVQMKADEGAKAPAEPHSHMVHDERYSEDSDVVQDGTGRIIGLSIVEGRTRITIGLGRRQGVRAGMEGYVKRGSGMLASFQIEDAQDRVSHATVDVTPDMLHENNMVVVNPSQMPKSSEPQHDMKARVLDISIVGGRTRIMVGRGEAHGARWGMQGFLVGSGGRPFARFTLEEVHSTHSTAFVDHTIDEVRAHTDAILNPAG